MEEPTPVGAPCLKQTKANGPAYFRPLQRQEKGFSTSPTDHCSIPSDAGVEETKSLIIIIPRQHIEQKLDIYFSRKK
jgi:hypothetical protein